MSNARIYFFDVTGKELINHKDNGKCPFATSSYVKRNGEFVPLYRHGVSVADFCNMRENRNGHDVTIADFPGMTRVGVKIWYDPKHAEKFWLVAQDYFDKRENA